MHNDANFCRQSCFGVTGYHGSCCRLEQRDWIIGPVTDCEAFLARLGTHLGRTVHHSEVFMDHAEGSAKFSDRPVWQSPQNFPAMRVTDSPDHRCTFYNPEIRGCMIYSIRPQICSDFACDALKNCVNGC